MKKFLLIGLIVAVVLICIGGAGLVYARVRGIEPTTAVTVNTNQNGDRIVRPFGYGPGGKMGGNEYGYGPGGMMGNRGYGSGGMMGGCSITPGAGVMRNYVISAFANAVGLTVNDVNTRLAKGETLQSIALAQGKTAADLPALATQVRKDALDKAVADGVITQAQENLMLQRMNNNKGFDLGLGFGNCPMWDNEAPQP